MSSNKIVCAFKKMMKSDQLLNIIKILLLIVLIASAAVIITATSVSSQAAEGPTAAQAEHVKYQNDKRILPDIVTYRASANMINYSYVVDRRTGCVYIVAEGERRYGITPAMNPDGTVVTAEQLGLSY